MTLKELKSAIIPDSRGRACLCDERCKTVHACLDAAILEMGALIDALDKIHAVGFRDGYKAAKTGKA